MEKELLYFFKKYPKSKIDDYVRTILQSEFFRERKIPDSEISYDYLLRDLHKAKKIHDNNQDLYEFISNDLVKVNLYTYDKMGFNLKYLNNSFVDTTNNYEGSSKGFKRKLNTLNKLIKERKINLPTKEAKKYIEQYISDGYPLIHHSKKFVKTYHPAYRLIHKQFITDEMRFMNIKNFVLKQKFSNKTIKIAIEGKSGSGKSTIAMLLLESFDSTVIHVDDFFLDDKMKTKERLAEIGGNINYEALKVVLEKINVNEPITFNTYNCKTKQYKEKTIVKVNNIVFIEGVYCMHPELINYYDATIYLDVDEHIQIERLKERETPLKFQQYINEWIPLENIYFEKENIRYRATLTV